MGIRYVYTVLLLHACIFNGKSAKISGPYMSRVVRTSACEHPKSTISQQPILSLFLEVYNTSQKFNVVRGNVSVYKESHNIKATLKTFVWEDDRWKLVYAFNNANCRSKWLAGLAEMFGMGFQNCSIPKGVYSFQDVDSNRVEHVWKKSMDYGRLLWRVECCSKRKVLDTCWETQTEVVPA